MYGNSYFAPLELALVEEAQARHEEGRHRGRAMDIVRESRGGARLVVILEKSSRLALEVRVGAEMITHRPRCVVSQPVVKPLVVSVVEPLLLKRPFEVPVDLGHKKEFWPVSPNLLNGGGPERRGDDPPGALEDFRQDQHGHVA